MNNELNMNQADLEKTLSEIHKLNAETRKMLMEEKLRSKKVKWFEFTMLLALVAATVAATKLFLT